MRLDHKSRGAEHGVRGQSVVSHTPERVEGRVASPQAIVLATAHYGKFVASLETFLKGDSSERAKDLKQALRDQLPKELKALEDNDTKLLEKQIHLEKSSLAVRNYLDRLLD